MSTGAIIGLIVLIVLLGIPTILVIMDNTAVLRKEKELKATLKQLDIDAAAMPDDASSQEIAALQARVTAVGLETDKPMRSPFVISRPSK